MNQIKQSEDIEIEELSDKIDASIYEFEFTKDNIYNIISTNFSVNNENNTINTIEFLKYFDQKYTFKVKINEFIHVLFNKVVLIYDKSERMLRNMYEKHDIKKQGMLSFSGMTELMNKLLNTDSWKVYEYFK